MCGIAGWVSFERDLREHAEVVRGMTATMRFRGPDDHGIWLAEHAALGHHRLAVIDPAGGAQPLVLDVPGGVVAMTYSGETYNFADLRDTLRANGHRFSTNCDTEVVARGYLEWGTEVASRLNGMFAFAVWDSRLEQLVMVRDRLGIKPLCYYPTRDGVLFGSEPKAIFANPLAEAVFDLEGLRQLIAYTLSVDQPVWKGLRHVPPGGIVTVGRAGLRQRTYWRLGAREHRDALPATVARVRGLLEDAVRRQLVADVPICVLLSGGLDSSALTALAADRLARAGDKVHSFSVDFAGHAEGFLPDAERPTPDRPYVRDMVRHVASVHGDVLLDPDTLDDLGLRRRAVAAYDLPPGSQDRDRSLYLLFQEIRRQATVALSGESADEVFCGYDWFADPAVQRAGAFPWIAALSGYGMLRHTVRRELAAALDMPTYLRDLYASAVAEVDAPAGEVGFQRRMRELCYLHLTRMLRILLERKDRLSMAVGLEVRVPYCDHRLVEYVYNVPWAMKTFDGREKSLLRAAVGDLLPATVRSRLKSAYPTIQDPRHVGVLQRQARELAAQAGHPVFQLIDREWLRGAVAVDPARVPRGTRNGIEEILNLAVWLELYRPEIRLSAGTATP
jgi:asparagine synthase (glutamine-hydrolysing)